MCEVKGAVAEIQFVLGLGRIGLTLSHRGYPTPMIEALYKLGVT